jgi:hypothetical protein
MVVVPTGRYRCDRQQLARVIRFSGVDYTAELTDSFCLPYNLFVYFICRVIGKAGGLKFYSQRQSSSLLFWCFSACCMYSILSIQLPSLDRDDVLDPEVRDSQQLWCVLQRTKADPV